MKRYPLVTSRILETPLMITPAKLEEIMDAVGSRIGLMPHEPAESPRAALPGQRQDRKPYEVTPEGIAVIEVSGTLVNRGSNMAAWSGMTSYEQLSYEFIDAATDPAVKGILLRCDSPGGECSGVFDLADDIYSQRGTKPIVAMVNDSACSAAFLIASQADKIIVTQTGAVGSIGVIAKYVNMTKADEMAGLKYTTIFAGARKNDLNPHEEQGPEAFVPLRKEVNRLADKFVASVSRGRGLAPAAIRATEAGLFFGETAVEAGLADEVGTLRSALESMRARIGLGPNNSTLPVGAVTRQEVVMAEIPNPVDDELDDSVEKSMPEDKPGCKENKMETPIAAAPAPAALGAQAVLQMVQLAGLGIEAAAELVDKGMTAEQLTAHLLERKAKESPIVRSSVPLNQGGHQGGAIKALEAAAREHIANATAAVTGPSRRGLNPATLAAYARATAEALALEANPSLYDQYLAANPAQTQGVN